MKKSFYKDYLFKISIIVLSAISIALSALSFYYDKAIFFIFLPITIFIVTAVNIKVFSMLKNLHREMVRMDSNIDFLKKDQIYDMPISCMIVNDAREILWYNEVCRNDLLDSYDFYGLNLDEITTQELSQLYKGKVRVHYNSKAFDVWANREEISGQEPLTMIYYINCSELVDLHEEYRLSKPTIILIMIDNYEELFTDVRESEKTYLTGEIEKLFEGFIGDSKGVIRKLSNSLFMVVIEERYLKQIIESKFKILNEARQIKVENRMAATLSIGVGRGASSLAESEHFARQAMDMALGRGGDQAAVKTSNGFEFYGGVSQGVEKQTKVKIRIIANAISELITSNDRVIIMGHRFADLDSLGASIALARVAKNMGKEAYIAIDKHKSLATQLINKIEESGNTSLFLSPHEALDLVNKKTVLIIVDTHNPEILESQKIYQACEKIVVIDHHRKMVTHIDNAVIFYHEPYASSASEIVTEIVQYLGSYGKLSPEEAEALLAGITLDTKNFGLRTGVRTFEAAAYLRKIGADTSSVRALFANSLMAYQRKMRLVSSTEIYRKCAIASSELTATADMQVVAPQAADEMLSISGVDASFVLYPIQDAISISARSMGALNVQVIMEYLGGGGHQTMSGAQIKNVTMQGARQLLLESIDKYYESRTE